MWWLWLLVLLLALPVLYLFLRGSHYSRIFSDTHFLEFAQKLALLKPRLLERVDDDITASDDPRIMSTSAGIFLFYTISRDGTQFVHHFSLRDQQGYTATTTGEFFSLFSALLLGVEPERLTMQRSENTVFHVTFGLSPEEQQAFISHPFPALASDALAPLCAEVRKRLHARPVNNITTGIDFTHPPAPPAAAPRNNP
jgi:hypothetical protein